MTLFAMSTIYSYVLLGQRYFLYIDSSCVDIFDIHRMF